MANWKKERKKTLKKALCNRHAFEMQSVKPTHWYNFTLISVWGSSEKEYVEEGLKAVSSSDRWKHGRKKNSFKK